MVATHVVTRTALAMKSVLALELELVTSDA